MGQKKNGGQYQTDVKHIGDNRHGRMPAHIFSGKWRAPTKNRAQTVFPAHIGVNKFFFFMDQHDQVDQPVQAAADKNDKGQPD
jgi:hypothetical protein